jgi:uncharacterized protein
MDEAKIKIFLRDIKFEGLKIDQEIDADAINLIEEQFQILGPLRIRLKIDKADETVMVKTEVVGTYRLTCSRCLDVFTKERSDKFLIYVDVEPRTDFIVLDEDIRQEVLVALTSIVFCRENCQGLCAGCGSNLNRESCRCQQPGSPSRSGPEDTTRKIRGL